MAIPSTTTSRFSDTADLDSRQSASSVGIASSSAASTSHGEDRGKGKDIPVVAHSTAIDSPLGSVAGPSRRQEGLEIRRQQEQQKLTSKPKQHQKQQQQEEKRPNPPLQNHQQTKNQEQQEQDNEDTSIEGAMPKPQQHSSWLLYALSSGACAACNGVFAKLTTTELTSTIAATIVRLLSLPPSTPLVEYAIRATFFGLNLAFNALMWFLFTRALTRHPSTTRVSIVNTSANFMLTALLGLLIFREELPPLWFAGATMLVIGNVIIGRRDGDEDAKNRASSAGGMATGEEDDEEGLLLLADERGRNDLDEYNEEDPHQQDEDMMKRSVGRAQS